MARLLLTLMYACIGLGMVHAAISQEYCSLVVKVVSSEGAEENGALVQIVENDGRVTQQHYKAGGIRFCDLGILPVSVTVGPEGSCNQVSVRNVTLKWEKTYILKITYDPHPCQLSPAPPPMPICEILLRVSDVQGNWVRNPKLTLLDSHTAIVGDQLGRVHVVTRVGSGVRGSLLAEGYNPVDVDVPCYMQSPAKIEKQFKLKSK